MLKPLGLRAGTMQRPSLAFSRETPPLRHIGPTGAVESWLVASAVVVFVLSTVDAVATLRLIHAGCVEVNPAMRFLLDRGIGAFLAGKLGLTGFGIAVIVLFRGQPLFGTKFRAGHVLPCLSGLYAALIVYQTVLFSAVSIF